MGHRLGQVVHDQVRAGSVVRHVAADGGLAGGGRLPGHHVQAVLHHSVPDVGFGRGSGES